jgi:RNA polymerase sigma factor (sigma-70 family)
MTETGTTAVLQAFLDALPQDERARATIIQALIERAARRLQTLGAAMLYKRYPRLAQPPMNLQADELLSAIVERLLKALRKVHPASTREFFALANQHMIWELNDLARRLDEQPTFLEVPEDVPAGLSSSTELSFGARRILDAIEQLDEEHREVFKLAHIQGLTQAEIANLVGVVEKTVQRRLKAARAKLAQALADMRPT